MRVLWVSLAVLLVDQFTKVLVKTRMTPGEIGAIPLLGDWLKFTFTENPGMAFGITFGMPIVVTIFAILATVAIVVYLWMLREAPLVYRVSLAFILGGAIGNIIDRVFYARIFDYGGLFQGRVVDFIHVDLYNGRAADWIPFFGGDWVSLFPIWNVADMSIVCGVAAILFLQRRLMPEEPEEPVVPGPSVVTDVTDDAEGSPPSAPADLPGPNGRIESNASFPGSPESDPASDVSVDTPASSVDTPASARKPDAETRSGRLPS